MSTVHCSMLNEANFKLLTFFCCFSIASLSNFFKSTLSVTNPFFSQQGSVAYRPSQPMRTNCDTHPLYTASREFGSNVGKKLSILQTFWVPNSLQKLHTLVVRGQSWSNGRIHPAAPPLSTTVTSNDLSLRL